MPRLHLGVGACAQSGQERLWPGLWQLLSFFPLYFLHVHCQVVWSCALCTAYPVWRQPVSAVLTQRMVPLVESAVSAGLRRVPAGIQKGCIAAAKCSNNWHVGYRLLGLSLRLCGL